VRWGAPTPALRVRVRPGGPCPRLRHRRTACWAARFVSPSRRPLRADHVPVEVDTEVRHQDQGVRAPPGTLALNLVRLSTPYYALSGPMLSLIDLLRFEA